MASSYSLQYGVTTPTDLVARAVELGQPALALTDRDGVRGAVRFIRACVHAGVAPVLGVDLALSDGQQAVAQRTPVHGSTWRAPRVPRLVLLARNRQGWSSLCRLLSLYYTRAPVAITRADIAAHADGLVALMGPDSPIVASIAKRRYAQADEQLQDWRNIFGENLHIQITSHRHEQGPLSTAVAARTLGWANQRQLPCVIAHSVRYLSAQQAPIADVLDASRRLVPLDDRHRDRVNAQGFFADTDFMGSLAQEISVAAGLPSDRAMRLLTSAARLATDCALTPADLGMGDVVLPEDHLLLPKSIHRDLPGQGQADAVLRARCEQGLSRYSAAQLPAAHERLATELRTVSTLGFANYFLTVAQVVDLTRSMNIRVAARGSGAGSVITYLLGISGVDPLEHGLLMERFLTTLRRELPDIDIDVESARRTDVYDAIIDRFGKERVACVSMPETYRIRHALRDVGAALGWSPADIDSIAKTFPQVRARDIRSVLAELPELRHSGVGRLAARGELDMVLDLVEGLDALPRHIAMHPCGVIIANASLHDRTPIEPSGAGYPMTSFDKDDVEHMGFLKLDVLGVRMQSALAHAVTEVARVDDTPIDLERIPRDDAATFALIQSTRTLGCFQIESPGQRELIGKFAPETFHDLIVDISLFRPGPVKSDMITPFLSARQGWTQATYLHEDLRPILAETHGVVVFHEQVLRIISVMTGCSLAEADETRRSMKNTMIRDEVEAWFIPTAVRRGYDQATVQRVWEVLRAFAAFGFCKAHAAAFALPTYQSAWFKAHYPAAFFAGVLTHDPGMYPKRLIIDDARNMGIEILGLDVNASDTSYVLEQVADSDDYGIRLSLLEVSGLGIADAQRIIDNRPYQDLPDFFFRAGLPLALVEKLLVAGAFDSLYGLNFRTESGGGFPSRQRVRVTRRDLLLQAADLARGFRRRAQPANDKGQQLMLSDVKEKIPALPTGLPEMTTAERVRAEMDVLGIDVSCHVVDFYDSMLADLQVTRARDLLTRRSQSTLVVAGIKIITQTPPVRSGRRVIFLTLDDATGPVDVAFFDDVQADYATTLLSASMLLVRGVLRRTGPRGVSIRATGCWDLRVLHDQWMNEGLQAVRDAVLSAPIPVRASR